MRDVNRIKPLLYKLEKLWLKEPDLRFGQIICLLQNQMYTDDIFYIEEDELEKAIDELIVKRYK